MEVRLEAEKSVHNTHTVLWLSASRPQNISEKNWSYIYCNDLEQAKFVVKSQVISAAVVDTSLGDKNALDFLIYLKTYKPAVSRVAYVNNPSESYLEKLVNETSIFRCINSDSEEVIGSTVEEAIKYFFQTSSQQKILSDIAIQNKKLEELTQNLEFLVEERTKNIETSKNEVAKKLKSMRELVSFIKELSLASIVDDWLLILGTDVRVFHGVGFPFLAFIPPNGIRRVITFRGKDLIEVESSTPWPSIEEMRTGNREDQVYLANLFGRPIANVLALPLSKGDSQSVLYFEYAFTGGKLNSFTEFLNSRYQAMVLSLDRILLEQQTRYASKQWESTFDSLQDPVSIIDFDYQVIRSNKSFYPLKKKHFCYKLFGKSEDICVGCPVKTSLKTGKPQTGRIRVDEKIYEVSSFPVSSSSGSTATNFINYYVDVTSEKKLFYRLVQNEKMAALGSLAGNIAHELNNPLTGIRSLSQLLQVEAKNQNRIELAKDLDEIERAAERSQKTIRYLLEFSEPVNIQDTEIIDLNDVVNRTIPMLKAGMRDHRSDINLFSTELRIKANFQLIQQVLFNIVLNACQAMQTPGSLKITTGKSDKFAYITVEDTGHGIAEDDLKSIFEPFFTTKEKGQGTGIGLSMSKSIVERFGGKILVSSVWGKGTKMSVELPLE